MSAKELVAAAEAEGVVFRLEGTKVKLSVPEDKRPTVMPVIEALRPHRDEVRHLLARRTGRGGPLPASEVLFLAGLVGGRVWTPCGVGKLVEVHSDYAVTEHAHGSRLRWYATGVVLPLA